MFVASTLRHPDGHRPDGAAKSAPDIASRNMKNYTMDDSDDDGRRVGDLQRFNLIVFVQYKCILPGNVDVCMCVCVVKESERASKVTTRCDVDGGRNVGGAGCDIYGIRCALSERSEKHTNTNSRVARKKMPHHERPHKLHDDTKVVKHTCGGGSSKLLTICARFLTLLLGTIMYI